MVDTIGRKQLAEQLRHFVAGQMTNDEFEDKSFEIIKGSKDTALSAIFDAAWSGVGGSHDFCFILVCFWQRVFL
ncbi:MAG: hypothetical protein A2Y12_08355 [Planctomycetes bacterium GWF2_42_9]|nr:MAG: hypothetical protein A2Y12_08355 [Planctomycetes bacterium GWF2_42_9]HAL44418.1 hypothetical protein [Phycisphaerales bacterium]